MACLSFEDNNFAQGTCGYLIGYNTYARVLSECEAEHAYERVLRIFNEHGWNLNQGTISIGQQCYSVEDSYQVFCQNHGLHEKIYQACMSIWR